MKANMTFTVGRLWCTPLRDELNRLIFKGADISFIEGSGFFERDFVIKGQMQTLNEIKDALEKQCE